MKHRIAFVLFAVVAFGILALADSYARRAPWASPPLWTDVGQRVRHRDTNRPGVVVEQDIDSATIRFDDGAVERLNNDNLLPESWRRK